MSDGINFGRFGEEVETYLKAKFPSMEESDATETALAITYKTMILVNDALTDRDKFWHDALKAERNRAVKELRKRFRGVKEDLFEEGENE